MDIVGPLTMTPLQFCMLVLLWCGVGATPALAQPSVSWLDGASADETAADSESVDVSELPVADSSEPEWESTPDEELAEFESTTVWRRDAVFDRQPQRVETLDREQMRRRQVTNLAEAIQWMAAGSLNETAGGALGMTIDGLGGGNITVLENGVPVTRHTNSNVGPVIDATRIPVDPERVRRVEIHRGVGPTGSGASGGVLVNIVTDGGEMESGASLMVSSGATANGTELQGSVPLFRSDVQGSVTLAATERVAWTGAGTWLQRQAWDGNLDGVMDLPEQDTWSGSTGVTLQATNDDQLRVDVRRQDSQIQTLGALTSPLYDQTRTREWRFALRGEHRPGATRLVHDTSVLVFNHRFDKVVRESGFERNNSDTDVLQVRNTTHDTFHVGAHDISVEGGLDVEFVERTGATGPIAPVQRALVGAGAGHRWYSERVETQSRAWAGGDEGGAGLWLAGTDVMVDLGGGFLIRSGVSRTFRRQTVEELFLNFDHAQVGYRVQGNEDLRPETLWTGRSGVVWSDAEGRGGAEIEAFVHQQEDLITTEPTASLADDPVATFTYVNIARAQSAGTNATVSWEELPLDLAVRLSWAWLPVSRDLVAQQRLFFRSEHSLRGELRRELWRDRLEVWTALSLRSQMTVPDGQPAAPSFTTVDVGMSAQMGAGFSAVINASNITDQVNSVWGPRPGRLVLASLSWASP